MKMLPRSIGENVARFRETMNPAFLFNAAWLVVRQRRVTELLYGAYCGLLYPPPTVSGGPGRELDATIREFSGFDSSKQGIHRDALIEMFGSEVDVGRLPEDFASARVATIARVGRSLVIGEYSARRSARIAVVGTDSCSVNDHYCRLPGVWHIHMVHRYGPPGEILVSTGDSRKLLDLWAVEKGRLRFVRQLKARLAGYSAAATVGGKIYLGTDFSCRPNYIETMDGERYFFPREAYTKYSVSFTPVMNRYIFCINADLKPMGGREALSIFDTQERRFIFCEYLDRLARP